MTNVKARGLDFSVQKPLSMGSPYLSAGKPSGLQLTGEIAWHAETPFQISAARISHIDLVALRLPSTAPA